MPPYFFLKDLNTPVHVNSHGPLVITETHKYFYFHLQIEILIISQNLLHLYFSFKLSKSMSRYNDIVSYSSILFLNLIFSCNLTSISPSFHLSK